MGNDLLYAFIHPSIHALIHWFIHSFIDSCTHSLIHSLIQSFKPFGLFRISPLSRPPCHVCKLFRFGLSELHAHAKGLRSWRLRTIWEVITVSLGSSCRISSYNLISYWRTFCFIALLHHWHMHLTANIRNYPDVA